MLLLLAGAAVRAQNVKVDWSSPRKYIVGGVKVEGNTYLDDNQIIQLSGLHKGMEVTVPGDQVSAIVNRLWMQKYFQDVAVSIDSLSAARDSAFFRITIQERPRMSAWTFSGVKSGERKDLQERLTLKRGGEFSEYVSKTSCDIISRYYKEKGFLNVKVTPQVKKDSIIKNAIRVNFAVDKGKKVKVKTINFIGRPSDISEFKLARSMKKTKSNKIYNFFSSKKFSEKEYPNDKKSLISAYNEAGYRDARLLRDSIYYVEENRLGIDLQTDPGRKYYFRNINWTGNSVYSSDVLNEILQVKKGDVYDMVTMQKRLTGGGKQNETDVSKVYRDNGYLFFSVMPVEVNIQGDSVDVEMRIVEGKQATLNNIIINGNDLTNERVVRRQVYTRPGYLFSQSDFERSIREIASLGQFDPESIMGEGGYSILPDQSNNTVDIVYNVTEKPSSQLELSGGWGGNTFVATAGVSFNNFSTRRMFEKGAWRPVPLGDAQNLSLRFQTSGTYYTALSASFSEPWLFGKKPTALSLSAYYTRQTNSYLAWNILSHDREMEVFGFSAGLGNRLKWPDNYFVLYNQLSWQTYRLTNWYQNYFIFDDGIAHNFSYTLSLSRNSTDQQIFPRRGQDISFSVSFTPPYSLFRKYTLDKDGNKIPVASWRDVNYNEYWYDASGTPHMIWSAQQRYRWIEYHKWSFKANFYQKIIGDLVLRTRMQFGYLGYYNRNWGYSPFEGFWVGGDGMTGYNTYGTEVISLRGYSNYSLTPQTISPYASSGTAYNGNVYDKFTVELRYPIIMQPQSTIFALVFLEGGNCWSDIRDFNPFQIKRSAGVGVRVFLPVVGLLGVDWGYGFDDPVNGKSQFHFMIGQEF
ncbi:MAG: BamA/TamA family outer membrane protein [Bacteroidales bacterium]|nr:BamA/TamA family outer membrane protein [Bacteroidales bacterium]